MRRGFEAVIVAGCAWGLLGCGPDEESERALPKAPSFRVEQRVHMHGLGVDATLVKTLTRAYAELDTGERFRIPELRELDRASWRRDHGAISRGLHEYLSRPIRAGDDTPIPVGVMLSVASSDPTPEEVSEAIDMMRPSLESAGMRVTSESRTMPLVIGDASARAIEVLARQLGVAGIYAASPGTPTAHAENTATWHGATTAHRNGILGTDVPVGLIEVGNCLLRHTHVLFDDNTVSYTDGTGNARTCSGPLDCLGTSLCGAGATCQNGFCRGRHPTQVASVIAQVAPEANIVYATNFDSNTLFATDSVACSPAGIVAAFDDFAATADLRVVSESYTCGYGVWEAPSELDGAVEDYHSRVSDLVVTLGAGNQKHTGNEDENACPNTWNSICVGGTNSSRERSCFSSFTNPGYSRYGWTELDREEPDVMALAGDGSATLQHCSGVPAETIMVASDEHNTTLEQGKGTSFAAPAVAGMIALMLDECAENEIGHLSSAMIRAHVRQSALTNVEDWRYSTPGKGTDLTDGAGLVSVGAMNMICNPGDTGDLYGYWDSGEWDPTEEGTDDPFPFDFTPEASGEPPENEPQDQDLVPDPQLTGYRWKELPEDRVYLEAGGRVRVTFSWHACVDEPDPSKPRYVATDYDLFLVNWTEERVLYTSQSFDDVNEGFDVDIPEGWDGWWSVVVVWPDESTGCSGTDKWAFIWYSWE